MAAYAALVSLFNLMEQIQNHPRFSTFLDKHQIEYLGENVEFLLDFIETYNSHGGISKEEAEDLERQIASAAYAAEYVIESHIVDQIHTGSSEKSLACLLALHKVIVDMDFIKEKVMEVKEKWGLKERQPTYSMRAAPSRPLTTGKTTMVGFDDELIQLMDVLTRLHSGRQIIPIVGMGGIGKTTLARNAYEHLLIKQHFDVCLWATISQEYSVEKILLDLLFCQEKSTNGTHVHELGEKLHKSLQGNIRYLIILDDIWNIEAWDEIQLFLPDNDNGSSIVITTRLSNMAAHFSSPPFGMTFLDEDKSWKLFCEKAFGEEDCPHELEEIGKKIVKKCKGLPLSIVVIGGHLRNSSRTKEYWVEVANDINSVLDSGENEQCLSILSLSYSHLPAYLKPCFLYMGNFPEDREIRVSTLVKLWVAEGLLKPSVAQSLEEIAKVCLNDLVDRNLVLVHEWSRNGKIRTCKIHDLLRDLCLMVAEKEKFLCAPLKLPPQHLKSCSSDFRLLKVQLAGYEEVDQFGMVCLEAKPHHVYLRYLESEIFCTDTCWRSTYSGRFPCLYLPSSVFLLWNLQTLIISMKSNARIIAPSEIWKMPQLRHLLIRWQICLPDPPPSDQEDDFVLHNLQTLSNVENFRLSEEVCKRIPNIKRLEICYDGKASLSSYYFLHNLCCFKALQSLTCDFSEMLNWRDSALNLPSSLRKLSLISHCLDCEDLTMIALSVPNLEVLKLDFCDSAIGQFEGEFPCLKSLTISDGNGFIDWNVDESRFPILESLTLIDYRSAEIPQGIGEIPTLQCIDLKGCSASAAVSAMRILVEQEELGGEGIQLQIEFWRLSDQQRFWEMVEEEGLTSNNLLLNTHTGRRLHSG